jgi:hypothetical protein
MSRIEWLSWFANGWEVYGTNLKPSLKVRGGISVNSTALLKHCAGKRSTAGGVAAATSLSGLHALKGAAGERSQILSFAGRIEKSKIKAAK